MSPQNSDRNAEVPDLLKDVRDHYAAKIARYGATPEGVDWSSLDKQRRRFEVLASCITATGHFSLLDVGCGYGAFLDYLRERHRQFEYLGVDISDAMIAHALASHEGQDARAFSVGGIPNESYDYVVASGIFNVMGQAPRRVWDDYVRDQIGAMFAHCRVACAANFLTSYSDNSNRKSNLYYADPTEIFDFCVRNFSMNVNLLHHYGVWDFTVQIFKRG